MAYSFTFNAIIKLLITENYYMQNGINQRSGVHIVIENNTKTPSIVSKGISVMPGTETNIGLQTTKILRLSTPFKSNCTNSYLYEPLKAIKSSDFAYSAKNCKGMCYVIKIYKGCKCVHPTLVEGMKIEDFFGSFQGSYRTCNITEDSNDNKCLLSLPADTWENDNPCDCNPECTEGRYKVSHL